MRKLMHGDGYGIDVVGSGDAVAVVDSAAAIGVGVGQNENVFVIHAGKQVVGFTQAWHAEEAIHIQKVEARVYGSLLPDAFGGFAYATLR